ncbi:MAG: SDR family oxidoreductase [Lachnospiraceae bacterium]|nr:SDR family oxidoreductase [Lachnospiraceae bacterium]
MSENGQSIKRKRVLLTGASSGIGAAIAEVLSDMNCQVFCIGRDFKKSGTADLINICCDLLDTDALIRTVKDIRKEGNIDILINNAGCAYYGLHEELDVKMIQEMVRTDLEVPMILTQLLLRDLKANRGTIINISSVTALSQSNPHGAAYGALKAGLRSFSSSIFEESRKHGVRVSTIMPDMTKTKLYRNADFDVEDTEGAYLEPDEVAEAVRYILERPEGVVIPEMVLRPQLHRIRRKK